MELIDKVEILADLYNTMIDNEAWYSFFDSHFDSFALAVSVANGNVLSASTEGEASIDSCYNDVCDMLGLSSRNFSSLDDLLDQSAIAVSQKN